MKRIIAILLLLCLMLAGCGAEETPYVPTGDGLTDETATTAPTLPQTTKELQLPYDPDAGFHPYRCTDQTNRVILSLVYQGLFAVDSKYRVEPILCKNYQVSADLRVYTFYLEKAAFSDGQYLTAHDVVASYGAARESGYFAGRFTHIAAVEAIAEDAVRITLDTSYENLPILLDIPIIKQSQVAAERPMGTGPYMLELDGAEKQLRRNTAWWSNVSIATAEAVIPLIEGQTPSQIRDLFELSGLGLVCTDAGSDSYVDFRGDYELWESENGLFLYLGVNEKSKVLSAGAIRNNLTYAIDRDALVANFFRNFAHSATLPASPFFPYYNQNLAARYSYNPERFSAAVNEAQPAERTVVLLVSTDDARRVRVARSIKKMLEAGGLTVTMSELSGADFRKALQKGNFDLYLGQTKLSPNMDLSAFFTKGGALSYGEMDDPALQTIANEALANSGNYQSLHEQVMQSGQLCPILFRSYAIYGRRGILSTLTPARDNVFYYSLGKTMETALIKE